MLQIGFIEGFLFWFKVLAFFNLYFIVSNNLVLVFTLFVVTQQTPQGLSSGAQPLRTQLDDRLMQEQEVYCSTYWGYSAMPPRQSEPQQGKHTLFARGVDYYE